MVSAHVGGHAGHPLQVPLVSSRSLRWGVEQSGRRAAACPAGLHGATQRAREPVSHNPDESWALGGNYLI